jgi:hypothetical protein
MFPRLGGTVEYMLDGRCARYYKDNFYGDSRLQ